MAGAWPGDADLVVLDELHKYRGWKGFIKGEYDVHGERIRFMLTGSARMDVFRRGGDSLQRRYHYYRLHPLSLAQIAGFTNEIRPGLRPCRSGAKTGTRCCVYCCGSAARLLAALV
jgi:uncharacterized protein